MEGEPGTGKTTFMKAVCRTWTAAIIGKGCQSTEQNLETLEKRYAILLAFVLRQVKRTQETLIEIIQDQFSFLNITEIYAILNNIEKNPNETCLFFDGLDELKYDFMQITPLMDIITKREEPAVLGITTTRSLGISQLKRYHSNAVQAHVKLCGFNKEQIRKYISLYFEGKSTDYSSMEICIDIKNLWTLASIPIRLQMMCFVYNIYKKLGNNMLELYNMLIKGLLDHMERRNELVRTSEDKIMKKYHETMLIPTAKLANTWDKQGNLKLIFLLIDIQEITGDRYQDVINLGCITKYFAAYPKTKSFWNFTHLSLQEFFVAYHIAHDPESSKTFANKCLNMRSLEKYRLILEFLCSMAPEKSNTIITEVVKQDYTEHECIRVLNHVYTFMDAYEDLSTVDIPLPRKVILEDNNDDKNDKRRSYLADLFEMDSSKHKNMKMLKVHHMGRLPGKIKIKHIKGLFLTIRNLPYDINKANELVSQITNDATIFELNILNSAITNADMQEVLSNIGSNSISIFTIKGAGVTSLTSNIIRQQPKLKVMSVKDTAKRVASKDVKAMCDEANRNNSLSELKLVGCLPDFGSTPLNRNIKVTVCSQFHDTNQFSKFCNELTNIKPNIYELDFSSSRFSFDTGKHIGQVVTNLQSLVKLKLRKCGLTAEIMSNMEKEIVKSQAKLPIQELDLLGNKLSFSDIDKILDNSPQLHVLLISCASGCHKPESLGKTKVLVVTGIKENKTIVNWTESCAQLDKLYLLYAIPDFSKTPYFGGYNMRVLYILGVPETEIDHLILQLSTNVHHLENLEELHVTTPSPVEITCFDKVLSLIKNMPPWVKHLSLCGYQSNELIHVAKEKQRLKTLRTINIGSVNTDPHEIQIICQEVQEQKRDVKIYFDQEESLIQLLYYSCVNPPTEMPSMQDVDNFLETVEASEPEL